MSSFKVIHAGSFRIFTELFLSKRDETQLGTPVPVEDTIWCSIKNVLSQGLEFQFHSNPLSTLLGY